MYTLCAVAFVFASQVVKFARCPNFHNTSTLRVSRWEGPERRRSTRRTTAYGHRCDDCVAAACAPLLVVPALRGGDAIDDTSVHFLLETALKTPEQFKRLRTGERRKLAREKEEEEQEKKKKREQEKPERAREGLA